MAKRRKSGKKRTLSKEQIAKMQAGRKRAALQRSRVEALEKGRLSFDDSVDRTLLASKMHD